LVRHPYTVLTASTEYTQALALTSAFLVV